MIVYTQEVQVAKRKSAWGSESQLMAAVRQHRELLLTGEVLAIDPSTGAGPTSYAGYSLWSAGEWYEQGIIIMDYRDPTPDRMRALSLCLAQDFDRPDVLIVEQLNHPKVHFSLKKAVGAIYAGCHAEVDIEMPAPVWHAHTPTGYVKTDDWDAFYIGETALYLARSLEDR